MYLEKYQALGNDYLVLEDQRQGDRLTPQQIQRICHRNFGIGSDGILIRCAPQGKGRFAVRILNPDGSEAEKSGNGLRIFARYLWDQGHVDASPFLVETLGGNVRCEVRDNGESIAVEMGRVTFLSDEIPVLGARREVLRESLRIGEREFEYSSASIGNPHCVVFVDTLDEDFVRKWGAMLEVHENFPKRTNVQFAVVEDRHRIRLQIWERGAGYTLASGSSSSAVAAVACRLHLTDSPLEMAMPGGTLKIDVSDDYEITMTGPAERVAAIELDRRLGDV
ncbi:MAG: diaminopimelate epimerase [Pirellulaceae bacterium]|nr:diaminopimelate epimerase [Planctomycetales bacterium]